MTKKTPTTTTITLEVPADIAQYFAIVTKKAGHNSVEAALLRQMQDAIREHFTHIANAQDPSVVRLRKAMGAMFGKLKPETCQRMVGLDRWPFAGTAPKNYKAAVAEAKRRGREQWREIQAVAPEAC